MMRTEIETKTAQITFRIQPTLRLLVQQEAAQKALSEGAIIIAALRQRFARKLRAAGPNGKESRP
jgi:hypothetical protein